MNPVVSVPRIMSFGLLNVWDRTASAKKLIINAIGIDTWNLHNINVNPSSPKMSCKKMLPPLTVISPSWTTPLTQVMKDDIVSYRV